MIKFYGVAGRLVSWSAVNGDAISLPPEIREQVERLGADAAEYAEDVLGLLEARAARTRPPPPGAPDAAYTPYELRLIGAFVRLGWRDRAKVMKDIGLKPN